MEISGTIGKRDIMFPKGAHAIFGKRGVCGADDIGTYFKGSLYHKEKYHKWSSVFITGDLILCSCTGWTWDPYEESPDAGKAGRCKGTGGITYKSVVS